MQGAAWAQSALENAATQLQSGQWVEFQTNGFNRSLLSYPSSRSALEYAESLKWDPVLREFHFVGGGHYEATKHLVYSESTNTWVSRSVPSGFFGLPNHGYDHIGLDANARILYHRQFNSGNVDKYNLDSKTWTRGTVSVENLAQGLQVAAGVEWFPELGRIVYVDGDWGVFLFNPSNNTWSKASDPLSALGSYHNFAEYSPRHKLVIFGGGDGSRAVYKISATGQITRMRDAPVVLGITHSMMVLEPVSGNFLVFHDDGAYEYDPVADSWASLSRPPFLNGGLDQGVFNSIAGYVPDYGVILVGKFNFDQSRVWLYRHRAGSGAPVPSITLSASPTSVNAGGSTTLTWNASNASTCTASGGWSGTKALTGTQAISNITATTTFTLTCTHSTGGSSNRSVNVSVVSGTPGPTVSLNANPTQVAVGEAATLNWTTTNATSCSASGSWSGSRATMGSANVGPLSATSTYTLDCTGAGGSGSDSVTITVGQSGSAPVVTLSANPTTVASGGTTQLTWSTENATSCTASGGWSGNRAVQGQATSSALTTATSFTLNCTGSGGQGTQTVSVNVTGGVSDAPADSDDGGGGTMGLLALIVLLGQVLRRMLRTRRALGLLALVGAAPLASAQDPLADFQARASGPGVVRAISFDTAGDVTTHAFPDGDFEASGSGWDQSVKASGGGSLRFNLPGNTGSGVGGSWRINFSDNLLTQFDAGDDFFIQWRQRFDSTMLGIRYSGTNGGMASGFKQVIIGEGDRTGVPEVGSCSEMEIVAQNTDQRGIPQMYHSCVSFAPFEELFNGSDFKLQNAVGSPYCLYSEQDAGQLVGKPPCFSYVPNEWLTFQVHVKLGARGAAPSPIENHNNPVQGWINSTVEMWAARDGQPSVLIHRWTNLTLHESEGRKYGKIWLLPYMTNKSPSQAHGTGHTWYDELIISRQRIPDPGTAGNPSPFVTLSANPLTVNVQGTTTLTWSAGNVTSCTASGGWSGSRSATGGSAVIGPIAQTTAYTLTCTNGSGGSVADTVTVNVASSTPGPTVNLSANPSTVSAGGTTQINWTTSSATSCTASGGVSGWPGSKSTSGSQNFGPINSNTTFTLACTGVGGTTTRNAVVTLSGSPAITLTATPATVSSGQTSVLQWSATSASTCTASGAWAGNRATSGQETTAALTTTSTYNLSCTGNGGTSVQAVTVNVSGTQSDDGDEGGSGSLGFGALAALALLSLRRRVRSARA